MYNIPISDLEQFINDNIPELENLKNNLPNLTYIQNKEYRKLAEKINLYKAFIWYESNKGNIRGFIDRLPTYKEKIKLLYFYNNYDSALAVSNQPSTYTHGLVPGLNAKYPVED